jgi:uncharacterized membrane protein
LNSDYHFMKRNLVIGITIMCMAAVCTSFGQLLWKLSSESENTLFLYIGGYALYGIGAVLMIIAFKFGDLSILHPMLSVGFILAIVWGRIILEEPVTFKKLIGIAVIIAGMIFLGLGGKQK